QDGVGPRFQNYEPGHRNIDVRASYQFEAGVWYHLAVTRERGHMKIYVNGDVRAEGDASGIISDKTKELWIGRCAWAQDFYLNGLLKDVAIWRRALTDAEIGALAGR
ncbi:MAG: LamG domain-containing protein, partial [Verrucomicrobiales bacterium]|nr:LamG domain-containing protein [Verrucomicrobiales bacterium]